ncbi:hypothetical protein [Cellulomonas sp. Leaf334]|uniref:hypothetical protein n=1 Tax=Cellulomonas sp. Leaf334 TaxID=1736339 RepID=UPI0006FC1003|nr:hypothetical protein [Cellulomonas sp. Leaf334]KQR11193.1 hypothetical protein ASF78_16240 [Cellulomonas sp. Leaf334]
MDPARRRVDGAPARRAWDVAVEAHDLLSFSGEPIAAGLTAEEVERVEGRFGFRFAPVHRAFLSIGMPRGPQWPNWRTGSVRSLHRRLQAPVDGVVADVLEHDFWPARWGARPVEDDTREAVARAELARVPALVPLVAWCYLPAVDALPEVPVLTVERSIVSVVGHDLAHYVGRVFSGHDPEQAAPPLRVPFWSDVAALLDPTRRGLMDPARSPGTR